MVATLLDADPREPEVSVCVRCSDRLLRSGWLARRSCADSEEFLVALEFKTTRFRVFRSSQGTPAALEYRLPTRMSKTSNHQSKRRSRASATGSALSPPTALSGPWAVPGVCLFLVAAVCLVFGATLGDGFVNYDDPEYVLENPAVNKGLAVSGMLWAFTQIHSSNWHPITWISHMLDCQWFGLNPAGHHFTNVALHAATAILLFLVLTQMTGFLWRSAFVAALFAVHPQHVESVAWVAERKDVLSGLFFMLALGAYVRYVRSTPRSLVRYSLVALFFALGLMSKPMLVTFPCVLLLLDYWPLRRMTPNSGSQTARFQFLILEKLPLFLIAAGSCAATLWASTAMVKIEGLSLPVRVGNALTAYAAYLGQTFWPVGLAVFYPHRDSHVSPVAILAAAALLVALSAGAFLFRKRCPWIVVGWLWYLGMLVPVIGIVQVGSQARADRYTYLPIIGIYVALVWFVAELSARWPRRNAILIGGSALLLALLTLRAREQTSYWRDSESLWRQALACTEDNYLAHCNLAKALSKKGDIDGAIEHFKKALEIDPTFEIARVDLAMVMVEKGDVSDGMAALQRALEKQPDDPGLLTNLGNACLRQGRVEEAIAYFEKALRIKPADPVANDNLGSALLRQGRVEEAIAQHRKALELKPEYEKAHNNLAFALSRAGRMEEAIAHYRKALELKPGYAKAEANLGGALLRVGRAGEGIEHLKKALEIDPKSPAPLNLLAWVLATSPDTLLRDGAKALNLARQAVTLSGSSPSALRSLAAAYAEGGQFSEAAETARAAIQRAGDQSNVTLAEDLRAQLRSYEAHVPIRDSGLTPPQIQR